jgi:hypothetical protein
MCLTLFFVTHPSIKEPTIEFPLRIRNSTCRWL